jgi:hypothetical protein
MKELKNEVAAFINSRNKNQWLDGNHVQLYLRKSHRCYQGDMVQCLDLASISVDEKHRNKGLSKKSIKMLLKLNPFKILFIENVLNPHLYESITKSYQTEYSETHPACIFVKNKRAT